MKENERLSDMEIETALRVHNGMKSNADIESCLDCPLFSDYTHCTQRLIEEASDYIQRLKAKTERLKKKNKKLKESNHVDLS